MTPERMAPAEFSWSRRGPAHPEGRPAGPRRSPRAMPRFLLALLLLALTAGPAAAEKMRVGVVGSPPFVVDVDGDIGGLCIDVWEAMARELKLEYRFVPYNNVEEALRAVQRKEVDAVIGPVTITAPREASMAFTQPYFRSSLGIMASSSGGSLLDRLRPFMSTAFLVGALAFLGGIAVVGTLFWLVERTHDECQFPRRLLPGILDGMWLAITTMSTVGYGDRYPVTGAGRIVASLWILVSMAMVSTVTATIATAFTLSQIGGPQLTSAEMLAGKVVATVRGSTAVDFALQHRAQVLMVDHLDQGISLLQQGQADAVIFDRPMLAYYLQQHPQTGLVVSASHYDLQDYGFALPLDSPLLHPMNVALLKLAEEGVLAKIDSTWLGKQ